MEHVKSESLVSQQLKHADAQYRRGNPIQRLALSAGFWLHASVWVGPSIERRP